MTRCPKCNRRYTDPSLSFCVDDGSVLERYSAGSELVTEILPGPPPTVQMPPPRPTEPVANVYPNAPPRPQPYGWANDQPPQVWRPPPPPARPASQQQTVAAASLVLGLLSITVGWFCGGPVFAFLAVILGAVALLQIKSNPTQYGGKPLALVGLLTGGLVLLFTLAMMALWIVTLIIGSITS